MSDENQTSFMRFADQENPYYASASNIPLGYLSSLISSTDLTEKANWAQARAEVRVTQGRKLSTDFALNSALESVGMVLTPIAIATPLTQEQHALSASDGTTAIIYNRSTLSCDKNGNLIAHPSLELVSGQSTARTIREFIQQHGVNTEPDHSRHQR